MIILAFIGLIIGLNYIPRLVNVQSGWITKAILVALVASTVLFLVFTVLAFCGYTLKGFYDFSIIRWVFVASTIAFFSLFKNSKRKIVAVCLLTPHLILAIGLLIFNRLVYERSIDTTHKIYVSAIGFLGCGETFVITETRFGIFDKEVSEDDHLCISGTYNVETVKIDDQNAEFLIYHHGQSDDSGPYRHTVERKNKW